jgi:type IV pilus assembly protein PilY1
MRKAMFSWTKGGRGLDRPNSVRGIAAAALLSVAVAPASSEIAQTPLVVATAPVPPNIMLLLDTSGSMANVMPEAPYDPQLSIACHNPVSNAGQIDIRMLSSGSDVRFRVGNNTTNRVWGTSGTAACFDPGLDYSARLYADSGTLTRSPGNYLPATYSGHYLNWYFGYDHVMGTVGSSVANWGDARKNPATRMRMEVAQQAARALVQEVSDVRMGLSRYDGAVARIEVGIDAIASNREALLSGIDALTPAGMTPLAQSMHSLGRYFVEGHNGMLTLHPGQSIAAGDLFNESQRSAYQVFNRAPGYSAGVAQASPIQQWCQRSAVVLMTDGQPQGDRDLEGHVLADYSGDCMTLNCDTFGRKPGRTYESLGSGYLDDITLALYDIDLRPDLVDFAGRRVKQNVITHVIAFADEDAAEDPLMQEAAERGGGLFRRADDSNELIAAFQEIASQVTASALASSASVATNSTRLDTNTVIYQARFNSEDWSGQLLAFKISPQDGTIGSALWDAADRMPSPEQRNIRTYRPAAVSGQARGLPFEWQHLEVDQETALALDRDGELDGHGEGRLQYLRGSRTLEDSSAGHFRSRSSVLGAIVNSNPFYIATPDFGYASLPEGGTYDAFRGSIKDRPPMLYVGGNDGMLHAFHAGTGDQGDEGRELFAYVPAGVFARLGRLSDPDYRFRYYVDGSPRVGDACLGTGPSSCSWATVLVGTTGAGGRSVFALDVTDPAGFDDDSVLWEFTNSADRLHPEATAALTHQHHPDLGYTIGQPAIVRLSNGSWAAIFGNGYDSPGGKAVLYIRDLLDGSEVATITLDSSGGNGLSTPLAIDATGDGIADRVYVGDLKGNLWRVDLTANNTSQWRSPFTGPGQVPLPLFVARDGAEQRQPITAQPEAGRDDEGKIWVFVGTGRYFGVGDNNPSASGFNQIQSFYGIKDTDAHIPAATDRDSVLVKREILSEIPAHGHDLRVISEPSAIGTSRGWYLDLLWAGAHGGPGPRGERAVHRALLRNGRIIFTTLIPSGSACDVGGIGWLMELDAFTGGRLDFSPFDLNDDGLFNEADYVLYEGQLVPVSGKLSTVGLIQAPGIIEAGPLEYKYTSGSTAEIEVTVEKGDGSRGRQAWRQLR